MLTRKQYELLLFINKRLKKTGIPPSFDEMKEALALASKSGIHRLITALEERGFIRRLPNRARAMEVLKLPEVTVQTGNVIHDMKPSGAETKKVAENELVRHFSENEGNERSNSINMPVMGRIAASVPISAIQHQIHTLSVSSELVGSGEHYALEVRGDSMVGVGILDGDTVIIKRSETAVSGEIVVALVDSEEATLKHYKRRGDFIALEAANPAYETRIFEPDRVNIQGKLVGLIRKY